MARACKVSKPTVTNWLGGRTKALKGANLFKASRKLGVNPGWLENETGPMRGDSIPVSQSLTLDPRTLASSFEILRNTYELHNEKFLPGVDPELIAEAYEIAAKLKAGLPANLIGLGTKFREWRESRGLAHGVDGKIGEDGPRKNQGRKGR